MVGNCHFALLCPNAIPLDPTTCIHPFTQDCIVPRGVDLPNHGERSMIYYNNRGIPSKSAGGADVLYVLDPLPSCAATIIWSTLAYFWVIMWSASNLR
jgi:hypothetical protein